MPRSTAHSTGLVLLASPKGHCSAIDRRRLAPVLGVGGEAVGRQRLGHDVHGGAHRALPLARRHARGERAPVLLADVCRHLLGLVGPEPTHGLAQEAHEEVVAALHEAELQLLLHAEVALGGPARARRRCARSRPGRSRRRPGAGGGGGPRWGAARRCVATSLAVTPGTARTWRKMSRRVGSPKAAATAATAALNRPSSASGRSLGLRA